MMVVKSDAIQYRQLETREFVEVDKENKCQNVNYVSLDVVLGPVSV